MVDRSPEGKLEVVGGVLRYINRCNWKMLVDNQTDTTHPMVVHESSAGTAARPGARRRRHAQADGGRGVHALRQPLRVLR
jgi:phenylpropionate dioxygenase-like ring-hydroxylating dioxygenase large terminal subunit